MRMNTPHIISGNAPESKSRRIQPQKARQYKKCRPTHYLSLQPLRLLSF